MSRKRGRTEFVVTFSDEFDEYDQRDIAAYVRNAVEGWAKGGDPDGVAWALSDTVTVKMRRAR